MAQQRLGIIMNGVTGRMGMNQHLIRSIVRDPRPGRRGADERRPGDARPDPGRPQRGRSSRRSPRRTASTRWTTDLDAALAEPGRHALLRCRHHAAARRAAAQGDRRRQAHLLREADRRRRSRRRSTSRAPRRRPASSTAWCRTSCSCPGLLKLKMLIDSGFFGRILSVRGEFGYWVFEGDWQPAQRPSWNYRKEDGGGIILDMLCHWRYVLDNLFGEVQSVSLPRRDAYPEALGRERQALQGRRRRRRLRDLPARGRRHRADQHARWCDARAARRPRHLPGRRHARLGGRRAAEMLDARRGSTRRGRCGIRTCRSRSTSSSTWQEVPDNGAYDNGFKVRVGDVHPPRRRGRAVQVDAARRRQGRAARRGRRCKSWKERRWIDVPRAEGA